MTARDCCHWGLWAQAVTCLAARSLEGLCAQAGEVPHAVNTRAPIEAWAGGTFVHIWGQRRWELGSSQPLTPRHLVWPGGSLSRPPGPAPHPSRRPCLCSRPGTGTPPNRAPPGTGRRSRTPWRHMETVLPGQRGGRRQTPAEPRSGGRQAVGGLARQSPPGSPVPGCMGSVSVRPGWKEAMCAGWGRRGQWVLVLSCQHGADFWSTSWWDSSGQGRGIQPVTGS